MSVSSTTNRATYAGNGVTTAFAFPYYFVAQADLVVMTTDASGNITMKTLNSDYTISGSTDANGLYSSGGTINFSVAPATGLTVTVYRDTPHTQAATWTDTDTAKAVGFDKLTLIAQRLFDLFTRVPLLPDGFVATFNSTLPAVMTPNAFLAVNASGNGWTLVGSGTAQGTVTSVGLAVPAEFQAGANVTASGSLSFTKVNQSANRVWAGPTTGAAAAPAFRALVAADIPQLALTSMSSGAATVNQVPVADGAGNITWQTIVGTGTVTSVSLSAPAEFTVTGSPVSTTGTLTFAKAAQAKNTVWAGPATGSNAAPSFRGLAAADLPILVGASSGSGGTAGAVPAPSAGDQVKFLRGDATWAAVPQGTVTSVDLAMPASEFSVTGDPVSTSGTITVSKKVQLPNTVWAGPTAAGPSAAPTFRSLVAVDLPVMVGATNIASGVAGAVPAPSAGQGTLFLRGDGTWSTPTTTAIAQGPQQVILTTNAVLASIPQSVEATGAVTLTMPVALSMIQSSGGNFYASSVIITNTGTSTVTVNAAAGETINGSPSIQLLYQNQSVTLFPNSAGNGWLIT